LVYDDELAGFGGDAKFYSKQLVVQLNKSLFNDDRVVSSWTKLSSSLSVIEWLAV